MKRLLIILFLVWSLAAAGQLDGALHDARGAAMGGCWLPSEDSAVSVDIGWRQGFMLKGMANRTLALGAPLGGQGRAGLLYSGFGDADYNEQQLAAGYALHVAPWLKLMVYGLYSHVGTADAYYETQRWLDAGGAVVAGSGCLWGYLAAGSRRWDDDRPWGMYGGMSFIHNRQLITALGFSVEERMRMLFGMEYLYAGCVAVRAGLCSNPLTLTFGVGYRQRNFHVDLTTEAHSVLGLSPQITLGLCL